MCCPASCTNGSSNESFFSSPSSNEQNLLLHLPHAVCAAIRRAAMKCDTKMRKFSCLQVAKVVAPKKAALKEAEASYEVVMVSLRAKQAELKV